MRDHPVTAEAPNVLPRIAAGDEGAVDECLSRYGGLVYSIARKRLGPNDVEDAVQDIFIDLWQNAGRYDPSACSEKTFIAMITRRRLIDRWRRSQRRPTLEVIDSKVENAASSDHHQIEASAEVAVAAQVLGLLKPIQRRILRLSIHYGLSHSEIADALDTPLGTVKSHLRRGLIAIREALSQSGTDNAGQEATT